MIDDYSGLQKAAILLITLGPEKASAIFQHLKEDEIESLTLEIANTRSVSPQDKESVLDEYYQVCLAQQYIAEGGIGYAKELLEKALGSEKAQGVISKLTASLQVRPFEFVRKTEPAQLLNFIQDEHPQTIAMILSYLSSSQAAMILGALPPEKQADVARRIAQMDRTSPDVIKEVERVLERKLSSLVNQDYTIVGGIDSIVNILNSVDRATEKRIMESLEVDEPELAEEIRKKMFVFEDIVTKPNNIIEAKGNQFKETLLRVVYAAVRITPAHSASRNLTVVEKKAGAIVNKHKAAGSNKIVAIASSTGGPKALQSVIPFLPAELLAPVVLVQHMPAGFTKSMAERLNELSQVQVKEASNGEVLKNGVVYIAPGGTHIAIKKSGASHVISFNDMPPISGLKPCANIMFDSLTSSNYDEVVCVVLTGMGADGTNGILSLGKSKPIYVIAQDEKSSVVYGMPRAIYEAGVVDEVVTLSDVAKAITKNVGVK